MHSKSRYSEQCNFPKFTVHLKSRYSEQFKDFVYKPRGRLRLLRFFIFSLQSLSLFFSSFSLKPLSLSPKGSKEVFCLHNSSITRALSDQTSSLPSIFPSFNLPFWKDLKICKARKQRCMFKFSSLNFNVI